MVRSKVLLIDLGIAAILLTAMLCIYAFPPTQFRFYPRCLLFQNTGIHCPGCGGFRAAEQLVQGNITTALHNNVLAIALLPLISMRILYLHLRDARTTDAWSLQCSPFIDRVLMWSIIVFFVIRNIPIWPFELLAPLP